MLSSTGCNFAVIAAFAGAVILITSWMPGTGTSFTPDCSRRSENISWYRGEYIWKYTHNAYDFSDPGEHSDLLPDRVAQLEDSGMGSSRQRAELPRFERAGGDVERGGAFLSAASQVDWA